MWGLLTAVTVASLMGSLHCAGMCGPFALLVAGTRSGAAGEGGCAARPPSMGVALVGYHLGRWITYSLLGLVAGALGLAINTSTAWSGWQQGAAAIAGLGMIIAALVAGLKQWGWWVPRTTRVGPVVGWIQAGFRRVKQFPPLTRSACIGFLTTWLPCGWLYVFVLAAAGTGSILLGAAVMMAFWVGTLPVLTGVVVSAQWLARRPALQVRWWAPVVMLLLGCYTLCYRAPVTLANQVPNPPASLSELQAHVSHLDEAELPCCPKCRAAAEGRQP